MRLKQTIPWLAAAVLVHADARADNTVTFPSGSDTYAYLFYPYMYAKGDSITGTRTSSDASVGAISYDLKVDGSYLYCDCVMDLYVDNQKVGSLTAKAYQAETRMTASKVAITATSASPHTLKIVRVSATADDCGSVVWKEDVGTVTFHKAATTSSDADGDGHTSTSSGGDDCNDSDASIHPGATEACDNKDNDCDRQVDEGAKTTYYLDRDYDTWGDAAAATQLACAQPVGYAPRPGDCDDTNNIAYPGAPEWCDQADNDCNGKVDDKDFDFDGFIQEAYCGGEDCNDNDPAISPDAPEIPADGVDNNCDGVVDEAPSCESAATGQGLPAGLGLGGLLAAAAIGRRASRRRM